MTHNLAHDRFVTVETYRSGTCRWHLGEILAGLCANNVRGFPALRPHQQHCWYAFLAQTAVIAADHAKWDVDTTMQASAEAWQEILDAQMRDTPFGWHLIGPAKEAALLQTALGERGAEELKNELGTPDELDILAVAKNHDLKLARGVHVEAEHWLFALISLQTMEGYGGKDNYGIVRMNGGLGNRPLVTFAPSPCWSARFRRDLPLLLRSADPIHANLEFDRGGAGLLWTLAWDRKTGRSMKGLHPYFVEVCRAARLVGTPAGIRARVGTSSAAFLENGGTNGVVGDPWTPTDRANNKSFTLSGGGFNYRVISKLFSDADYLAGTLGVCQPGDEVALFASLVRGQGKTEGYHERVVPITPEMIDGSFRERVAVKAKERVDEVANVRLRVLSAAIRAFLDEGETGRGLNKKDARPEPFLQRFDAEADAIFFDHLWAWARAETEDGQELATREWQELLHNLAKKHLNAAFDGVGVSTVRRYKAIAAGEGLFEALWRKYLPALAEYRAAKTAAAAS